LWLRGVPAAQRAALCDEALRRVGLEALAERPAHACPVASSSGWRWRAPGACSPTSCSWTSPPPAWTPAPSARSKPWSQEFRDAGVTVVMSTHNLGQAKRLGTRVAYLEAGRVVVDLPVDRFFNDELPPEAAQFLKGELPWR
jgi:tungstate transport system ATP-binding protein